MNSNLENIIRFVRKAQKYTARKRLLNSLFIISFVFSVISVFCNAFFNFSSVVFLIYIWDAALIACVSGIIVTFFYNYFFKRTDPLQVITALEEKSGLKHPAVSLSIELAKQPVGFFSENVFASGANQIGILKQQLEPLLKVNKYLLYVLLVNSLMVISFFLPSIPLNHWNLPFASENIFEAVISPGTITVPKSKPVVLQLKPVKKVFPYTKLTINSLDGIYYRKYLLRADSLNNFEFKIDSVSSSVVYRYTLGKRQFRSDTIYVLQRPSIVSLTLSIKAPSYTGGGVKALSEGQGDFSAYAGSEVTVTLRSNPLLKAHILLEKDTIPMMIKGCTAQGKFTVKDKGSYTFALIDTLRQSGDSLPEYSIELIPDEWPVVQITKPGYNTEFSTALSETLNVHASDDFAISSVYLHWFKNSEKDSSSIWNISSSKKEALFNKELLWSLKDSHLYPGDTVYYWATATDSWPLIPKHLSTSDTFWFRIPGFEEIHKSIVENENKAELTLRNVQRNQKEIENEIEKISEYSAGGEKLSWEQQKAIENVKKDLKSQAESLKKALEDLEKSVGQLKNQGTAGDEISRKMDQIEKTIQDLIKQYGDSLFAELDKKSSYSMNEMKEAIQNVKEMLPELGKRLDNTLQFLEQLKEDRKLASLAMRAENLAQQQMEISKDSDSERSKNQQENIINDLESFQKRLDSELKAEQNEALKSNKDAVNSIKDEMKKMLGKRKLPQRESMNSMSSSLLSLSEKLKSMISSSQEEKMEKARNAILEMARDVITVSDWQKQVIECSDDEYDRKAAAILQQMAGDAFQKLKNRTDSISVISPQIMQEVRTKMRQSQDDLQKIIQSFEEYDSRSAMNKAIKSMRSLANTLLFIASRQGKENQSSGSGGGMMSGLRKLSQRQAGVNTATSELLRSLMNGSKSGQPGQGNEKNGSGSSEGTESARKAAQQEQKKIADELERLKKQFGNSSGENMKRLEELEKEARKLAEFLNNPQSDIIEKQNKFLTRMLQSALSMHRQDEKDEERKSEISKTIYSGKNVELDKNSNLGPDEYFIIRRRALQGKFPESYRPAINAYFDSLGVLYLQQKKSR